MLECWARLFTISEPDPLPSVATPSSASANTHTWSSKGYRYAKTTMNSPDYDQALADGYMIFDVGTDSLRVLRKRIDAFGFRVRSERQSPLFKQSRSYLNESSGRSNG